MDKPLACQSQVIKPSLKIEETKFIVKQQQQQQQQQIMQCKFRILNGTPGVIVVFLSIVFSI